MALKGLNDIPSGKKQLVLGLYIGNHQREGEQMRHTKCKLRAGHSCLLRPRKQETEVPPSTAFRFMASAGIRRHPKGQTIAQDKEAAGRKCVRAQSLPGA